MGFLGAAFAVMHEWNLNREYRYWNPAAHSMKGSRREFSSRTEKKIQIKRLSDVKRWRLEFVIVRSIRSNLIRSV